MIDKRTKNSLLGQLEQEGLLGDNSPQTQHLPFGILTGNADTSPFCNQEDEPVKQETPKTKIVKKRLNELDNNFFQEGNFVNVDDMELTNSEKAAKIRLLIDGIDKKIFMLEDSDDEILLNKLKKEKEALAGSLALLNDTAPQNLKTECIEEKKRYVKNFIFKFFPVLKKNYLVRHALNKLIMLNESTKELLSKKIPYGEQEGRYNDFIAYLNCANVIHAKLTKKI